MIDWVTWRDPDKNNLRYVHITFDFGMSYDIPLSEAP